MNFEEIPDGMPMIACGVYFDQPIEEVQYNRFWDMLSIYIKI